MLLLNENFKSVTIRQIIFEAIQNIRHFCWSTWHTSLKVHKKEFSSEFIIVFCNRYPKKKLKKSRLAFELRELYLFDSQFFISNLSFIKRPEQNQTENFNFVTYVISKFLCFKLNNLFNTLSYSQVGRSFDTY